MIVYHKFLGSKPSLLKMDEQSNEPFLKKEYRDSEDDSNLSTIIEENKLGQKFQSRYVLIALHFALITFYTVTYVYFMTRYRHASVTAHSLTYSPAQGAIEYTTKKVDGLHTDSIFAGHPNPDSDAAWSELLHGINLRINHDEMAKLGQSSLKLADGSGYLGTLGVYHELHCIKRIRKYFYKDYYYPNETRIQKIEHETHAEHCLELLRQAAICKGDISVTSYKWLKQGNNIEPTTLEGAPHQCINWDKLSSWAEERSVNLFDPNLLVLPERN
ncbi:tat pathway signal sequence protein [Rutstroemia sp. NJR-2017a BVV2]|nr:tat pathway signal sequence protein [Rutstroemia sp. NJR-2017a BVV2]